MVAPDDSNSLCSAGNAIIKDRDNNINDEYVEKILDIINECNNDCATAVLCELTNRNLSSQRKSIFYLLHNDNKDFKAKLYSNGILTPAGKAIVTKILILYNKFETNTDNQINKTKLFNIIANKLIKINGGKDDNFRDAIINELTTQCIRYNKLELLNGIVKSLNEQDEKTNKPVRNRVIDYMFYYGLIDLNNLNNMKDSLKGYNNNKLGISIDDSGNLTVNAKTYSNNIFEETVTSSLIQSYTYKRISRKNIFFLLRHDRSLRKDDDFNGEGKSIFKEFFWDNNYEDIKNPNPEKTKINYLSECLEDLNLENEDDQQLLLILIKNSQITYLNYDIMPKLFADYIRNKTILGKFKTDFINEILNEILNQILMVTYDTFRDITLARYQDWDITKQGKLLSEFLLNLIDDKKNINEFLKEDGLVAETIKKIEDQDLLVQLCFSICTSAYEDKVKASVYAKGEVYEELTPTMKMIINKLDSNSYNRLIKKLDASKKTNAYLARDCIKKYRPLPSESSS